MNPDGFALLCIVIILALAWAALYWRRRALRAEDDLADAHLGAIALERLQDVETVPYRARWRDIEGELSGGWPSQRRMFVDDRA